MGIVVVFLVFCLTIFVLLFLMRRFLLNTKDSVFVRHEVQTVLTEAHVSSKKSARKKSLRKKKHGTSLKYKMMFFSSILVLFIVLLVSIPFTFMILQTRRALFARGLDNRLSILMEGLASGIRAYMPCQNTLELNLLLNQIESVKEVEYVSIVGHALYGQSTVADCVWASNDPSILKKIDTEKLLPGVSHFIDPIREFLKLAIDVDTFGDQGMGSIPHFNVKKLLRNTTDYIFYKPVFYRLGQEQDQVGAIILLKVSTKGLVQTISKIHFDVVRATGIIALIAVIIGLSTSYGFASLLIDPLLRLADHVAMIRDTEDKEELTDKNIHIDSNDEIGNLGAIVNTMTQGLVKAAVAAKDLTIGREVQKMFIPLETDISGKKLTTGFAEDAHAQFFGYYEGAKGVSGDYFDYLKLDDRHFAIIKCDVSGKGVPAALIMVEVATLFLNYFKDWTYKKDGYALCSLVTRINDLIESRGFRGRFVAFTLCIFDSVLGDVYFCNAGDNLVHMYDASEQKKETISLPQSPAAGVFSSIKLDAYGGFSLQKLHLDKDDVLFLYTDGIEESRRTFKNAGNNEIFTEDLTSERVDAIIEAVFKRKTFKLIKHLYTPQEEELIFDFSSCTASAENAIMALVSVEKIFRMHKSSAATKFDRVQVDRKIDIFLKKHFLQYNFYCLRKKPHPELSEYLYYTHITEDEQYDDLTLVAIKKK